MVVCFNDVRVVALDCLNIVKDYVQGRKLVEAGATRCGAPCHGGFAAKETLALLVDKRRGRPLPGQVNFGIYNSIALIIWAQR